MMVHWIIFLRGGARHGGFSFNIHHLVISIFIEMNTEIKKVDNFFKT